MDLCLRSVSMSQISRIGFQLLFHTFANGFSSIYGLFLMVFKCPWYPNTMCPLVRLRSKLNLRETILTALEFL
ncbi:hypothetical protein HanPSC8_Chr16g0712951 [Helianthus annuus]|nr:hypothetical protein HanPSC8_Chr16g0712951 [Helianthus annuus]